MALPACLLRVAAEVDPAQEDAWNRWYDEAHLPEIVDCPGFVRAARYVAKAADGGRTYQALYELDGPEALESPQFAARRGWGPFRDRVRWTTRLNRRLAQARNPDATMSDRAWPLCLLGVEASVDDAVEAEWSRWCDGEHVPQVTACPGFVQAARYVAEAEAGRSYLTLYELMGPEALHGPRFGTVMGWGRFEPHVRSAAFVYRRIAAREHGG